MKKLVLLLLCFFACESVYSQDTIKTKDGQEILSQVVEIGETSVKYRKWDNREGPIYSISISKINSIVYKNGVIDNFANYDSPENVIASSIDRQGTIVSNSLSTSGNNISMSVGNIAKQQDLYSKARFLRGCGYGLGALVFVGSMIWGISNIDAYEDSFPLGPVLVGSLGTTLIMATFLPPANELEWEAEHLSEYTVAAYELSDNLALNTEYFKYHPNNTSYVGVGLSLKF